MNVPKQVEYWRSGAVEDMAAAEALFEKRMWRHGLFFAHLALEKVLKAHVTRHTEKVPPKIHTLVRLAGMGGLLLTQDQADFLRDFNQWQLEGRYPDHEQVPVNAVSARRWLASAKEMMEWLMKQLQE